MGEILERHLEAIALGVEEPAVIGAAQAVSFRNAVFEGHAAMRAAIVDEPIFAAFAAEERQIFAEDAHALHRLLRQLGLGADRLPVAAQKLAHRRAGADMGETIILRLRRHTDLEAQSPLSRDADSIREGGTRWRGSQRRSRGACGSALPG